MIRSILKYPADVLQAQATDVPAVDADIQRLIDDMVETMYAAPGVGLAAPQVGVAVRLFVVDLNAGRSIDDLHVFVNPEILEHEGLQLEEEGCLSLPGFTATVVRPERVVVRGLDRSGTKHTAEGTGLLARAFQHEMDHLDGRLFISRLRGIKRDLILRKVKKLIKAGTW